MIQLPFTSSGVQNLLSALYASTDTELHAQADAVQTDFRLWMNNAFILSSSQQNYLEDLSDSATQYYGRQCAVCFINRLPIFVQFPEPPDPGTSKWITTIDNISTSSDGNGHTTVTGSFQFILAYK